jgi:hypothetical protein
MREAINQNPVVQIAVIGVLMIAAGLMLATQVLNKKDGSAGSAAPASSASVAPGVSAAPAGTAAPSGAAPIPAVQAESAAAALEPGPGLPREVGAAYGRGETIVLLVVRAGGIDDRLVKGAVQSLQGDRGLAVFVTRAEGIARYSRITQGVGVNQVPALVVVRPRDGGGAPEATVSYGFRGSGSVAQAVRDAVYKGRTVGYDPG